MIADTFTDILNVQETLSPLRNLDADQQPVFGIMTPQHMVEHLILMTKMSNGRIKSKLMVPPEVSEKIRYYILQTDKPIQPGFKAPGIPEDDLLPLKYNSLSEAILALEIELTRFHDYFFDQKEMLVTHPTMGELTHDEWMVFHKKHFKHHFSQFELV